MVEHVAGNVEYVQSSSLDARSVKVGVHALREGDEILAQGGGPPARGDDIGDDAVLAFLRARLLVSSLTHEE